MKRVYIENEWPTSWKMTYKYDLEEIYGEIHRWSYWYSYRARQQITLKLIKQFAPAGATILDIAAGQGNFSLMLAEKGYDVTWNDLRSELEGYVRLKYEFGKLAFAPGDAFSICSGKKFDLVLITEIIEHVAHPDEFLKRVADLIRPDGFIVMTTPNGAHIKNTLPKFSECQNTEAFEAIQFKPDGDGHIFLLHPDEVLQIANKSGLTVNKLLAFNNPLTGGYFNRWISSRFMPRLLVYCLEAISHYLPLCITQRYCSHIAAVFQKPD